VIYRRHEQLPEEYLGERSSLRFRKLSRHVGAEVTGLDPASAVSSEEIDDLAGAWAVHGVLVSRGLEMTPADLVAFSKRFGTLVCHPAGLFGLRHFPEVTVLTNRVSRDGHPLGADRSGMQWHSDRSFRRIPVLKTFLYGVECPSTGGDTEFCSMYAAYDRLERALRMSLLELQGVHDYDWYWKTYQSAREALTAKEAGPEVIHPAICTHPITGWRVPYLSEGVTRTIHGMNEDEGRRLVLRVSNFCGQESFTYAHKWTAGDLVMWDNMAVMHRATEFDHQFTRYMLRTQTEGTLPVLVD
jgi:taurine dioxygenase